MKRIARVMLTLMLAERYEDAERIVNWHSKYVVERRRERLRALERERTLLNTMVALFNP